VSDLARNAASNLGVTHVVNPIRRLVALDRRVDLLFAKDIVQPSERSEVGEPLEVG
jgi:hypothetical protein